MSTQQPVCHNADQNNRFFAQTKRCLACGRGLPDNKSRFCKEACRSLLTKQLEASKSLMSKLSIEFATLSLSESHLFLTLLPTGTEKAVCITYQKKVASDDATNFKNLVNIIENSRGSPNFFSQLIHHAGAFGDTGSVHYILRSDLQIKRLNLKKYRTHHKKTEKSKKRSLKPFTKLTVEQQQALVLLRLTPQQLESKNAEILIKRACKKVKQRNHPDYGGDHEAFIQANQAIEVVNSLLNSQLHQSKRNFNSDQILKDKYVSAGQWVYYQSKPEQHTNLDVYEGWSSPMPYI